MRHWRDNYPIDFHNICKEKYFIIIILYYKYCLDAREGIFLILKTYPLFDHNLLFFYEKNGYNDSDKFRIRISFLVPYHMVMTASLNFEIYICKNMLKLLFSL